MPRIAAFSRIVIAMYHEDHGPPHFHAISGEFKAVFGGDPVEHLQGRFPTRLRRLVLTWAAMHQAELLRNWDRIQADNPPMRIDPLP